MTIDAPKWDFTSTKKEVIPTRKRLIKERERLGMTQYEFADMCGISRQHYSQIESGAKNPSLKNAMKIKATLLLAAKGKTKDAVSRPIEDLFADDGKRNPVRGNPDWIRKSE